jgi:hypothetical protein
MKFEATIRVTYEVSPEEAPGAYGTTDPKIMAEIDQEGFQDHPESLLALVGPEGFTVEVKPVA